MELVIKKPLNLPRTEGLAKPLVVVSLLGLVTEFISCISLWARLFAFSVGELTL
jgi:hypothetical protein